jgi:Flp pilus assembly protein TadG
MTSRRGKGRHRGQALVEFSLILIPFLVILMGIADLGRGVYMGSGVSQAAREVARAAAVTQCMSATDTTPCTVTEMKNNPTVLKTVSTQKSLVPGLADPSATVTYVCTDVKNVDVGATCNSGSFISVTVDVPFSVLTPILGMVAPSRLKSTAHIEVP